MFYCALFLSWTLTPHPSPVTVPRLCASRRCAPTVSYLLSAHRVMGEGGRGGICVCAPPWRERVGGGGRKWMPGLTTGPPSPSPTYVGTTAHIPRGGGRGGGCRGGGEGEGEKREGDEHHPVLPTLSFFFLLTYRTTRPFFLPSSCSCSFSSSLHGWETHCDNFPLPVPFPLLRTPYERGDKQVPSWKEVHFHFDFF